MVLELRKAGHQVVALLHRADPAWSKRHPEVRTVVGDVAGADLLNDLDQRLDAVIYLPGLLREFPAKGITFERVHAEGVKNIIAQSKKLGATRWIQMSALGVGEGLTTGYYESKLKGEGYVRSSGMDWTIFRPSVIFSDRYDARPNFVSELGNVVRLAPVIPIFGDGNYRLQPVSLEEVSRSMVRALEMPSTVGQTYELGGPQKIAYKDILKVIASAQGLRKPIVRVPFGVVSTAAKLLDTFAFFPITRDQIAMLKHENIVRFPNKEAEFRDTFRLAPHYFEEGVRKFFSSRD